MAGRRDACQAVSRGGFTTSFDEGSFDDGPVGALNLDARHPAVAISQSIC